ncbi:hypothetical protein Tco_0889773 [Tanacetum coccineum]
MKSMGFWLKVIEYFEKETWSNRGYDSILSKWKNRVRLRISAFCAIFDNVQRRNKSGSCDLTVYQKACVEYAAEYDHDFFIRVVLAKFKESFCSAKGGLNLNEEADGYEVRDVQPMGRDRAKKKSSSSSRFEASSAVGGGIVDVVADKWKSLKSVS